MTVALSRMEAGNPSNAKSVGEDVQQYHVAWGPGYRLYFGRDDDSLIILLCGGSKRRQQNDIADAHACWIAYKRRKKETVKARVSRDAALRDALLAEAVDQFLAGEIGTGKAVLRDCIDATIGFERLAQETGGSSNGLLHMLGCDGGPSATHLFGILRTVQKVSGVQLAVAVAR